MTKKEEFKDLLCEDYFNRRIQLLNMFAYLEETDFFTAPSSTAFHCNYPGGLVEHSLNVHNLLSKKVHYFSEEPIIRDYTTETVAIAGLLHDVCKTNFYIEDKQEPSSAQLKYLQDLSKEAWPAVKAQGFLSRTYVSNMISWLVGGRKGDQPVYGSSYTVDDKLPLGHGEKSLYLISKYVTLTDEEAAAIRWHMVSFDAGIHFNYPSGFPFREAMKRFPLVTLLFTADMEASQILEA